jgi:2-C-methyl-D-erythritol 4-phosphate cytidylyltransferase
MLEIVIGSALALAVRDLIYELIDKYRYYKNTRDHKVWQELFEDIVADDGDFNKIRKFVQGGAERHLSVWAGLQAVAADCDFIAVHDGARPLIHPAQISQCLQKARETGAAASARPVSETLKRADASGRVCSGVDRNGLWIMETPQIFARSVLISAYEAVLRDGVLVTDEVSALGLIGHEVWLVDNPTPNPKITWPPDLALAERLLGAG